MKHERPLVALILLLAFALRVWGLDDRNVWWDEGLVAWAARLPAAAIVDWTAHDVHPPLYFLLQRLWWFAVSDGEFVMRYTSVLVGTLGVAWIYLLGRTLGGPLAGLLAALFLAISPFAVSWSQEMRMYIGASAAATAALWAALRYWQTSRWRYWGLYVAATAVGLWLLYLSVSVLIIANLAFLWVWIGRRLPLGALLRWAAAQGVVVLLYLPWLAYALPRMPSWSTAEPFTLAFFIQLYATTLAVGVSVNLERYLLPVLLVVAVLVVGVPLAWRRTGSVERRAGLVMLLLGLLLPALLVYIVSLPIHIFYAPRLAPRYLIPLAACFYTLLALGLTALAERRRWLAAAGTLLVVGVAALGLLQFYPDRIRRDDLLSLAATIDAQRKPGDAVLLYSDRDWPLFAAQYAGQWQGVPNGAQMEADAAGWLLEPLWQAGEGLWLATTPDAVRMDPQGTVRRWLEARAAAVTSWDYGENALAFYAKTPQRAEQLATLRPGFELPQRVMTFDHGSLAAAALPLARYPAGDTAHLALFWREPPAGDVQVTLQGPATRQVDVPAAALPASLSRQQVDLPLTPDLPAGRYAVQVEVGAGGPVKVGEFTLVHLSPSGHAALDPAATPLDVRLGASIRLLGYELAQTSVQPGEMLDLTLYWQAEEPVTARYKVFTHLLGEVWNAGNGNFIWGQVDSEPAGGEAPTTAWTPGAVIADHYTIPVAPDAPPGPYRLEVGLYGLVDGRRLSVFNADGQPLGDAVDLGGVEVKSEQ
ncbi:MAG TPA: glycosyltransferase family 39 protein [Anaerolineae bacterium]|nr:glycosyltransferase family 39 protein [Anaerolineae bacterium]